MTIGWGKTGWTAARLGGLARRVAAQTAMSATVMTGLHYASVSGWAPTTWLFGSEAEPEPAGRERADTVASRSLRPEIRFIAIPAREAFPDGEPSIAAPVPAHIADRRPPETARPVLAEAKQALPPVPAVVARPTPRPATRAAAAQRPASVAATEPVLEVAAARSEPLPFDLSPPSDVPERVRDEAPEPARRIDAGFRLSNLLPDPRAMAARVSSVGLGARDMVEGAAIGAIDLVR